MCSEMGSKGRSLCEGFTAVNFGTSVRPLSCMTVHVALEGCLLSKPFIAVDFLACVRFDVAVCAFVLGQGALLDKADITCVALKRSFLRDIPKHDKKKFRDIDRTHFVPLCGFGCET